MKKIEELMKTKGHVVSGLHLISTFIKRGVQPLWVRAHPMWEFQGAHDPTRLAVQEPLPLSGAVETRVRGITKLTKHDPCPLDCPVNAYDSEHPLPDVCATLCLLPCKFSQFLSL